jgi:hypothetical protein
MDSIADLQNRVQALENAVYEPMGKEEMDFGDDDISIIDPPEETKDSNIPF